MMEEEHIRIPVRVLLTLNMDGYLERFWVNVQSGMSHRMAFYACEADLNKYRLPSRYNSYESFKAAKSKHLRKGHRPTIRFV